MILKLQNLVHIYKSPASVDRRVLDIPQWELAAGQQMLLRGVSGSGKTTLFNIISGLLVPTEGDVWLDQQSLYQLDSAQRDRFRAQTIGYIFQTHHLLAPLTALENVVMPMAFARKYPRSEWKKRAQTLLDRVELADYGRYRPAQMSTGQRLRVAVARALANQPPLLLADEPTAALDSAAVNTVMDLIQQTCRENNTTLIVASHDPALNDRFAVTAHLEAGHLSLKQAENLQVEMA